jgi:hypothetical protein
MRTVHRLLVALSALAPAYVFAEVMDKELSIPEIWMSLLWGLVICAVATGFWRWLLVPSFALGLLVGVGYAWTEWFDPSVGPAIRAEAGEVYGYHANAAVALLLLAHVVGWFLSSWRSVVSLRWRAADSVSLRGRLNALLYAALLLLVAGSVAGLAVSRWIWISPVIFIGVAFLGWTAIAYVRSRTDASSHRLTSRLSGPA